MRPNYSDLPVGEWTDEESMHHTTTLFDEVCKRHPEMMEPYIVMVVEAEPSERQRTMQAGLRETFKQRYPA